ncbi:hypothetical protein [Marivirga arenosa]|uniref:Uncharacterized protein n=1 Tax=Marivirga arenosa TaxID=3059076 RepID=A0AA51ZXR0_9BACT|nr:hypothetical protein [Marivirga sp. BKB1-2]WNB18642.1 hypothetical protein QYS47_30845 [Marivirga sp. BKB1-2]
METHKIDQLFKQKLERHSDRVSADAFAKIQANLKGNKQKKGFPWMIAASVSILLVLSFGIVYNYNSQQNKNFAKLDLNKSAINLAQVDKVEVPELQKTTSTNTVEVIGNSSKVNKSQPKLEKLELKKEEFIRMASIEKIESTNADISTDLIPELRLSPIKHENKVIVEINYQYAENNNQNIISKSNNKLKSLASEFSLADLRNAKSELFASAFQLNKKQSN